MRIDKIDIMNFRLLRAVTLSLEERTTVVVGRNNSGKTSLTELFRRLLSESTPTFRLEDFSCGVHDSFLHAYKLQHEGREPADVRSALPVIEVRLTISYATDGSGLGPLGHFVIDLDPACTEALIVIRYELADGKLESLFEEITFDPGAASDRDRIAFYKALKERVPTLYKTTLQAVDPTDSTNSKYLNWSTLHELLQSGFINAQRWLDDTTHRDNDVLGKVLEALFRTASSELADEGDQIVAQSLDTAVEDMQIQLDAEFNANLKSLIPALSLFGYPGLSDPELRTETTLDVKRLLINHTKVRYAGANGVSLPEAYNGLGARNLIFILLQLLEFFKSYKATQQAPVLHLVFIEEPEAHLHPQMAEVFIRKLAEITAMFVTMYNDGVEWPVQFVVSTHSSHMANEARFEAVRYFLATSESHANHLRETRIKDLRMGLSDTPTSDREFLHQYMTLTRCDLFFADKAVLIEGCTERLLLPAMIAKCDEHSTGRKLASQYVSIVEICGAYAHRFFKLLEFLELRALIITDLDSGKANESHAIAKCLVSEGTHTTNGCLKEWFNHPLITPADLIAKTQTEKTKGIISLAYEVPEVPGGPCGRSFEDAFMLANQSSFGLLRVSEAEKAGVAWKNAKKENKTEFALKYALEATQWNVPRYIADGLNWLAEVPSAPQPALTPAAATPASQPASPVPTEVTNA
jgi:putative ATP-dependent endonuclease of OLD family